MFVVDTSVAVKWVIRVDGEGIEAGTAEALEILAQPLIAPDCMLGEFANAMFKKVMRREIGAEQARASVSILPDIVTFFPFTDLVEAALELALDIGHPVHDCIFLAAAVQLEIPLVTADKKFHANCMKQSSAYPMRLL